MSPLPAPEGGQSTVMEPETEAPPGGYLELDLDEAGKAEPRAPGTPTPGAPGVAPRRRPTQRTGPAFAAVAPKEVPGSAKSIMPIVIGVAAGSLALILAGVLLSRGSQGAPSAPAPAPVAAAPAAPAPAPTAAPAEPAEPAGGAVTPAALTTATPPALTTASAPAPTRREARTEPRGSRRGDRPAPAEPAPRTVRERTARAEPAAAQPAPAPAPAPAPVPAPPPPPLAAPAAAVSSAPPVVEDAPRYPSEGYRRPQMAEPQCVQRSIRMPRDLSERLTGTVTIRFAVGPDGGISLFQAMGDVTDPRLPDLLEAAVRACTFVPGADAQGKAVRMWVTMPIRFAR